MEESYKAVFKSCVPFANALYKILATNWEDNLASSPLSVHIILSFLLHGADAETKEEMQTHLHFSKTKDECDGYRQLISAFNVTKGIDLNVANIVYVHHETELLSDFVASGQKLFFTETCNLDFRQTQKAINQINSWVEEKTKKRITNIATKDNIQEDTKVVLVNAIYFKGNWKHPFNSDLTSLRDFHVSKDTSKRVQMMSIKKGFAHGELPSFDATFIELPYANMEFDMVILLPNTVDGLKSLEEKFNWEAIYADRQNQHSEVELLLPKFKIESKIDLKSPLQQLGMKTMFEDNANFAKLSKSHALKISDVIQKVFVEVNEIGTEAAAATMVTMVRCCAIFPVDKFIVDRPFMFLIRHKESNIPLFIGSVRDLADQSE